VEYYSVGELIPKCSAICRIVAVAMGSHKVAQIRQNRLLRAVSLGVLQVGQLRKARNMSDHEKDSGWITSVTGWQPGSTARGGLVSNAA